MLQLTQRLARLAGFGRPAPAAVPRFERRAKGVIDRSSPGARRIVVTVDEATFRAIGDLATQSGVSVSEAIRQLLRRALGSARRP